MLSNNSIPCKADGVMMLRMLKDLEKEENNSTVNWWVKCMDYEINTEIIILLF